MIIKASIIKAARYFEAKNDCRSYMCGFNITRKHIQATNGHVAVQMLHGASKVKKGIYSIKGNIPVKTESIEFIISKRINCAKLFDIHGDNIGLLPLSIIDGKYPELEEKIISKLMSEEVNNTEIPRINPEYIGLLAKAFNKPYTGIDLEFRGENKAVVAKIASDFYFEEFGRPTVLIMPIRKDK